MANTELWHPVDSGEIPQELTEDVYAFPCSVAQKAFWVLDGLHPGTSAGNIAVRFRLRGLLIHAFVEAGFSEIVRRHETLRTRFATVDGEPVQVIDPPLSLSIPVHDLRALPEEERLRESNHLTSAEAQLPFDLKVSPLLRIKLLQLAADDHILLVTVHHTVADGWSIGLITDEFSSLYESLSQGKSPQLPELPVQYADYAIWETERLNNGGLDHQIAYWKEKLSGLEHIELPTDRPRPPRQTFRGRIHSILLPKELTKSLAEFSEQHECTLFVTMLAALKTVLARWSNQSEIIVGTLLAGRNRVEIERHIGTFVNSVVLRTNLAGDPLFPDLLQRLKQTVLEAFENQDVPFERIVEEIKPKRRRDCHPVFQVNVIYQRDFVKPAHFAGIDLTAIPSQAAGSIYDLNFFLVERADGWRASVEFNTDLYLDSTALDLLKRFELMLKGVVEDAGRPISRFPLTVKTQSALNSSTQTHAAPANGTETELKRIWEDVLGASNLSVNADFFDAGGHSLLAVTLLSRIEKEFGKQLRLAALVEAPTIRQMAAAIDDDRDDARTACITPLRVEGSNPPLYLVHGVGGTVVGLGLLVRHLGHDQPVYALQSPPLDGTRPLLDRIETMAAQYIQEITSVQPHGPYHLLGYSLGGLIAFEMAQQLDARGEKVDFLGMLDTYQLGYWVQVSARMPLRKKLKSALGVVRLHLHNLILGPRRIGYLIGRIKSKTASILYRLYAARSRPLPSKVGSVDNVNWFAARNYIPEQYAGSLVLLRAQTREADEEGYDYLLGWGGLARGGIEAYDIPGAHEDMVREPNVQVLARTLRHCLKKAQCMNGLVA